MDLLRIFKWESMIKKEHIVEEIPSNREIYKKTFNVAWPSAVESICLALIGAVDMMMVGNLGAKSIASVGITTQPKFVVMAPVIALNIATTVLISRRKGENNKEAANSYLKTSLFFSFILSIILSLTAIIFSNELLRFAGASDDYILKSIDYFRIIMIGNIFYCMALTISAAQRGIGETKISLKINLIANIVNLIFNALLINGLFFFPRLEVVGAAIATALGNFIAFIIAMISILKKDNFLHINFNGSINIYNLKDIFNIASASIFEQFFLRTGFLMYAKSVAGLGTIEFAAHQIVMNIMAISFSFGDGLSIATSSLVGQSLGAKRSDMAIIHGKVSQRIGTFIAIFVCIIISVFRVNIVELFTNDIAVINMASVPMVILSFTVLFQIPQIITVGSLRGAGDVKFVALLMLISVSIIRPSFTWILCYPLNMGLYGAWISVFIDQITRNIISSLRFKTANWTKIKV